jgi:integrase
VAAQRDTFHDMEYFGGRVVGDLDTPEVDELLSPTRLWAALHAEYVRRHLSSRTIKSYRQTWFSWCESLGKKPPLRANPKDLQRFIDQPSRGQGKRAGPVLSEGTRDTYVKQLKAIYRWFANEQLTRRDLMAKFVPLRKAEPVPRALTNTELDRLFAHVAGADDPRLEIIASLAYYAALRMGEIARLRVEHIHLRDDPPWLLVHGKGAKTRQTPIRPVLAGILRDWLTTRPRTGPLLPDLRYPTRNIGPGWVSYLLAKTMREAGLEDTGHALRHSWATNTLRAGHGKNVRAVSHYLGHANLSTTENTYVRSYRDDVIEALGLAYDPRSPTLVGMQ